MPGAAKSVAYYFHTGTGVPKSYDLAYAFYQKAVELGHENAQNYLPQLEDKVRCKRSSKPVMFLEVAMACATRDDLHQAAITAGAVLKTKDDDAGIDSYQSEALIEGTEQITLTYTHLDQKFVKAEFTSKPDAPGEDFKTIYNLLKKRHGGPSVERGKPRFKWKGTAGWALEQGISLELTRHSYYSPIVVRYIHLKNNKTRKIEEEYLLNVN